MNLTKTNILHVRPKRSHQSRFMFLFNRRPVEYCKAYKYLGITLNEFLDFDLTAEAQSEAAGRALGGLITKTIKNGGLPFKIYSMLYECSCTSVSDYGSEIWGFSPREAITKVHLRAARSYLGLPKNVTKVGVAAEINWVEPVFRGQLRMVRQFLRITKMNETRLTKKIISWDQKFSDFFNLPTWFSEVQKLFQIHNLETFFNLNHDFKQDQFILDKFKQSMFIKQTVDLKICCESMPKLRTFNTFRIFGTTPSYINMPLSFIQRKYLAQLRLSSLPIRLETGRYERPKLPEHARFCQACSDGISVENEEHYIFYCKIYHEIRQIWLGKVKIPVNFHMLSLSEKFKLIFEEPQNVKVTAQFIVDAYNLRSKAIFSRGSQLPV